MTAAMESIARKPSRIAETFVRLAGENRAAIMPFVTAGYPTLEMTGQLIEALTAAGADLIEIGVPFSDPIADGPTVQGASQKALENGTTLGDCFELVRQARAKGIDIPLLLMGYANPFYQYGAERLAAIAAEIGLQKTVRRRGAVAVTVLYDDADSQALCEILESTLDAHAETWGAGYTDGTRTTWADPTTHHRVAFATDHASCELQLDTAVGPKEWLDLVVPAGMVGRPAAALRSSSWPARRCRASARPRSR